MPNGSTCSKRCRNAAIVFWLNAEAFFIAHSFGRGIVDAMVDGGHVTLHTETSGTFRSQANLRILVNGYLFFHTFALNAATQLAGSKWWRKTVLNQLILGQLHKSMVKK
eukprot:SAG31_NODE_2114_length_6416_cov_25.024379_7_plen_109_part_00